MATSVPGIPLSHQTVSEVSADPPAQPQTLIPSSDEERLTQAVAERRQEQEQADKLEEERALKAKEAEAAQQEEEEPAHKDQEVEQARKAEEQTSRQLLQTIPPTTSPHEALRSQSPVSLPSNGLPQAAIPAQRPATLLPPPTSEQHKRRRSPAVIAVLILLTVIFLGGASFAVYGAATGNWPWNVWHAQTSGTWQNLRSVAWSGSQLVAVGDSGTILASPDGRVWSANYYGTAQDLSCVASSGSQFVVVGDNGTILTSP
jgi:hypothetical protein